MNRCRREDGIAVRGASAAHVLLLCAVAACADVPSFGPNVRCGADRGCRLPLQCVDGRCTVPVLGTHAADAGTSSTGIDAAAPTPPTPNAPDAASTPSTPATPDAAATPTTPAPPDGAPATPAPPAGDAAAAPTCNRGRAAFCGRAREGIVCAFADEYGQWAPPRLVASAFADAAGWGRAASYNATIQFIDVDGDGVADVCGRRADGLVCAPGQRDGGFGEATLWSPDFADAQGWGESPVRWATLHFPDLDGDGRADVCAQSPAGHRCALSTGRAFGPLQAWGPPLAQVSATWSQPEVWGTLQYPDLDHDGRDDFCVRGSGGIHCALSSGQSFGSLQMWSGGLKDGWGGHLPSVWPTIALADFSGDGQPDLCGRGFYAVACLLNRTGRPGFDPADRFVGEARADEFGDDNGFGGGVAYYGTIQYPDVDGDGRLDVCGRAPDYLWCLRSPGFAGHLHALPWSAELGDARGWELPEHALSLTFADLDGDGKDDLCGRRSDGVHCFVSNGRDALLPARALAAFRDEDGFAIPSTMATIWFGRFVRGDCHPERRPPLRRRLATALAAGNLPTAAP
jgi:hypothetical protein